MQVANLEQMILLLNPILEHYREWTVDDMLTDIYKRCCQPANQESLEPKIVPVAKKDRATQLPSRKELLLILPSLTLQEQQDMIKLYNKEQITTMVREQGMKRYSQYNKDDLAEAFCIYLQERRGMHNHSDEQGELLNINEESNSARRESISRTEREGLDASLKEAAESLPGLTARERVKLLESFNRQEIWQIARHHDLRIPTINSKDNAIRILDNHFNFLELHRDMGNR